jgi:hypothetical protein
VARNGRSRHAGGKINQTSRAEVAQARDSHHARRLFKHLRRAIDEEIGQSPHGRPARL